MKKYNVLEKKTGNLMLSVITYDRKTERKVLSTFNKLKKYVNVVEVKDA